MKDQGRENLAELIQRLFDAEQADGVLDDIQEGERILRENPAPTPDRQLLDNIKAEIALLLPRRTRLGRRQICKKIAVAAAFIIIAATSAVLLNNGSSEPGNYSTVYRSSLLPTAIWESDDIAADDAKLAVFSAQIDQLENEVMTLEAGEDTSRSYGAVDELEIELIVVRSDFWKE